MKKRLSQGVTTLLIGVAGMLSACQSKQESAVASVTPAARQTVPPVSASSVQPLPDDSVPAIARREALRRQERIMQMDEAALRASQAMAEDDLEGAVNGYRRAVDGLP